MLSAISRRHQPGGLGRQIAGKYYADRLGRMDDDIDQMLIDYTKLREQGKEQAAARRRPLRRPNSSRHSTICSTTYMDLCWEDGDAVFRCLDKDLDAGVPYGTMYRLEMTLASPPALQVD